MNTTPFQFDRRIDAGLLHSLYEYDYLYIEEIFRTTLKHYDEDVDAFEAHHRAGGLKNLRKTTHKIKPVFGFIGMPWLQQICEDFEDKCEKAGAIAEMEPDYQSLLLHFKESKKIIEADLQRLTEYNKNME